MIKYQDEIQDKIPNKIGLIKDTSLKDKLSPEEKRNIEEIAQQERKINLRELALVKSSGTGTYNISRYRQLCVLFQEIYSGIFLLKGADVKQAEFKVEPKHMKKYSPKKAWS